MASGGPEALLPRLRAALSGAGPALLPIGGESGETRTNLVLPGGSWDDADDPTALAVPTSGSTGNRKIVLLPASALLHSAAATHNRLGGPGRWLLALPLAHVAGLQVLVRSLTTGTEPVAVDLSAGFDPARFAAAAEAMTGVRRYTALVPTQLVRILDAGDRTAAALAGFDAVLIGGAPTPPALAERARAAGVRLVTTYGATETCGGCVYDGVPLDGVDVETGGDDADGERIRLGGAVVARGYLGDPEATAATFLTDRRGVRWFRTDDLGTWDGTYLVISGRADDVIITGGVKVSPAAVEAAVRSLPGVAEAVVVGVPDAEWGQRVAVAVTPAADGPAPTLPQVRAHVTQVLEARAAPRQLRILTELPSRGPGKPDRAAIAALLTED